MAATAADRTAGSRRSVLASHATSLQHPVDAIPANAERLGDRRPAKNIASLCQICNTPQHSD